jgi:hypothetical protein
MLNIVGTNTDGVNAMDHLKFFNPLLRLLILIVDSTASARSEMMVSGWMMLVWAMFGVLLILAQLLAVFALLKYLFRRRD